MHICNNSVSEYYKLSHFVTILNNYIMFWLECIEIFTFFIWKYPEGYAGCAKKNRRDESAVFFSGAYRFTDCAILW